MRLRATIVPVCMSSTTGARIPRTIRVKLALICCIFSWMATLSARATEDSLAKLADDPRCARGLAWIEKNSAWVTDQQIRLTEIPAPEFGEARRGEALKELFAASGFQVRIDKTGNVIAERAGSDAKGVVLVAAHLDTVFPAGTNVRVKREGNSLARAGDFGQWSGPCISRRLGPRPRRGADNHDENDRPCR